MDKFSAISDPTRRKILQMLANQGPLNAGEIGEAFKMSPPAISQHLKILREVHLVRVEKQAQQRIYFINPQVMIEFEDWARQMTQLWNQRFDALDKVLMVEKKKSIQIRKKKEG